MLKDVSVRKAAGRIAALAAVVPLIALAPAGITAASAKTVTANGNRMVEVIARPNLPSGTTELGVVHSSAEISGAVGLDSRDEGALNSFLSQVTDVHSSNYHHYLAPGQYAERFGAAPAAVTAVDQMLSNYGLHPSVSANRILVSFHGSAANVERAFGVGLGEFRFSDGDGGYGTTSAVRLPQRIAQYVSGIAGLDNLVHPVAGAIMAPHVAHAVLRSATLPKAAPGAPIACPAAAGQAIYGGVTQQQLANSYGVGGLYSAGDLAQGQTVAVFELEPFLMSDIATFDSCYFGKSHASQIHVIAVDGGAGTGPGSGEAALDVEDVSAIAPDANIDVYEGSDSTWGSLDTYNDIAENDSAQVVTSSWGLCESAFQQGEPGEQQIESEIFSETAAQGQSVFAAAGDDGSDDCAGHNSSPTPADLSVDDPASQPYVTAVGGTTFRAATEPPVETVWNDGTIWGAGGGGISDTWAEPSWQAQATVSGISAARATAEPCSDDPAGNATLYNLAGEPTTLPAGTSCRLVPDVTALADEFTGITIVYGGQWSTIGGTSSATPLWAAMTAEMNASSFCSDGNHGLGFISPLLYAVASSSPENYAAAFNDITSGNNDNLSVGNGDQFAATKGYDLASGLGSPRVTNAGSDAGPGLAQQACAMASINSSTPRPVVSSLSSVSGSTAGGASVTISGSGFGASTGSVYFGTAPATVTFWSPTAVVVATPAYYAPEGTKSPVAASAPVTVVTTSDLSSALTSASVYHYTFTSSGASGLPVVDYTGPTAGPTAGGQQVSIVGSGFTGATSVTFGGAAADDLTVVNDNEITVTTPAEPASSVCAFPSDTSICQVQVVVTTPAGASQPSTIMPSLTGAINFGASGVPIVPAGEEDIAAPSEYDYAPAPTFTSVSPKYGAEEGGSYEEVQGTGFNYLTYEWTDYGGTNEQTDANFLIAAISPTAYWIFNSGDPSLTGPTVDPVAQSMIVVDADQNYTVPAGLFALAGITSVSKLSSHFGDADGGSTLTIYGSGFEAAEEVLFADEGAAADFGGTIASSFQVNSTGSEIQLAVPGNLPVQTLVVVCTETGCDNPSASASYYFGFAEAPVVNAITPKSGPAAGGTAAKTVTLKGKWLDDAIAVEFNGVAAPFQNLGLYPGLSSSYAVSAVPPPGKVGSSVKVVVYTAGSMLVGGVGSKPVTYTYTKSVPSAVRDLRAASTKDRELRVVWTKPVSNGGSVITGYEIVLSRPDAKSIRMEVSSLARSHRFTKLTGGVHWRVKVFAINKLGHGYLSSVGLLVK